MANIIEKTAKTVDEAVDMALSEINLDRKWVDVEVVEEGNKGFLGIFGSKDARVKVKTKQNFSFEKGKEFITDILNSMNLKANVEVQELENAVLIKITGDNLGILIGRRGETLDSLQYLVGLVVNKHSDTYKKVTIDIEGYRDRREDSLIRLANRLATKARQTKKTVTLEPMPANERRIIHSVLQDNRSVSTYSTGDDPYRKIIIKPKW